MNNTHRGDIGKLPLRLRFKRAALILGTARIGAVLVICEKIPSLCAMLTVARGAAWHCHINLTFAEGMGLASEIRRPQTQHSILRKHFFDIV